MTAFFHTMRDALTKGSVFSRVTPVCQVQLRIRGDGTEKIFGIARKIALDWLQTKSKSPLPAKAWKGEAFHLQDVGAQPTTVEVLKDPIYWACDNRDADKGVPQRTWYTEIALAYGADGEVLIGCRLQCITGGAWEPFSPTIPKVIRDIVDRLPAWKDGHRITSSPWAIKTERDIRTFVELLTLPDRRLPVIAVSLGDREGNDTSGVIDANALARRVCGAAHVVTLTGDAAFKLTDEIGKEFSVFHQAVRTWQPGFNPDCDDPADHRLALPMSISNWNNRGSEAFSNFLVDQTLQFSVAGREMEREIPSFARVREAAAQQRLANAQRQHTSDKEMLSLYEEEIEQLKQQRDKDVQLYEGLLHDVENDRSQHRDEAERVRRENSALQSRIVWLEQAMKESGKPEVVPIPDTFDDLENWYRKHLSGSVYIASRAIRAAKKSMYTNVDLVYRSLLILKDLYVPMKRGLGGLEMSRAYYNAIAQLGLDESRPLGGDRAGQFDDEYYVNYCGRKYLLNWHLKRGTSRDPHYCFRLYYHWHEESGQVLVGWFPTHLTTDNS